MKSKHVSKYRCHHLLDLDLSSASPIPISAHPVSLTELSLSRAPISPSFLMSRDFFLTWATIYLRLTANYHQLVTAYADEAHSFPSGIAPLTN